MSSYQKSCATVALGKQCFTQLLGAMSQMRLDFQSFPRLVHQYRDCTTVGRTCLVAIQASPASSSHRGIPPPLTLNQPCLRLRSDETIALVVSADPAEHVPTLLET